MSACPTTPTTQPGKGEPATDQALVSAPGERDEPRVDATAGRATWRALGTTVEIRTRPEAIHEATRRTRQVLAEVDRACSRFRPDSDLRRVNARAGTHEVSPLLCAAVRVALQAAKETDGLVDPTLAGLLTEAGYDRSFDRIPAVSSTPARISPHTPRWADLDVTDCTITTQGQQLDLGATGKAFAADLVALTLAEEFGSPVLASLGGDMRVVGSALDAERTAYPVTIGHTLAAAAQSGATGTHHLRLSHGALATSSIAGRHWQRQGVPWHHVIDPRTGRSACGPWSTVTVLAHTASAANTASTAALVLGADAFSWLTSRRLAARLVDDHDLVRCTPYWPTAGGL